MSTLHDNALYDDPVDDGEAFDALMRPDEDEDALQALAARRVKARRKKVAESDAIRKTVTGMLDSEGSALLFGEDEPEGSANNGPLVAEMEREHLQAIFNPLHNARQIAKELTLLEDHLIQPPQHCPDCIRKHLLRAEAYADEAMGLDEEGSFVDTFGDVQQALRGVSREYLQVGTDRKGRQALAQRVRKVRKAMSKMGFSSVLDSKMHGDAPAQPRVSEQADKAFGVKRGRSRKRALAYRGLDPRTWFSESSPSPSGDPIAKTVGSGGVTLSTAYTAPRKDVQELQFLLKRYGLLDDADGVYGPSTEAAVKAVQRAASLPQTGKFDTGLYELIFRADLTKAGTGSDLTFGPDALSRGAEIMRFEKAQQVLVDVGLLSDTKRNLEKGELGPYTEAALKNFLSSVGRAPDVPSKTVGTSRIADKPTVQVVLDAANIASVKASPLALERVPEVSPQAARGYLVGAGLLWPGEQEGGLDDVLRAALRDYQCIHGLSESGSLDAATSAALLNGGKLAAAASRVRAEPGGMVVDEGGTSYLRPWSKLSRKPPATVPGTSAVLLSMTVEDAQGRLNRAGASPSLVMDGKFGKGTRSALQAFQRAAGLPLTGSLDQPTIRALLDENTLARVKASRVAPPSLPVPPPASPNTGPSLTSSPYVAPTAPPALPKGPALPPDYAPDPTGSNATAFRAKFPQLGPEIEALMARERQIRSLARYGGALDDMEISRVAKAWWSLSKRTSDPWPAMHGAWLAGKAGNASLANQILSDVSQRFTGTPAGEAASSALASLPEAKSPIETLREAAPYLAAGAGVLLVVNLMFRGDR
jgi:peptidoglycan hydrolase-like protein with peptidoglycan-binding domain